MKKVLVMLCMTALFVACSNPKPAEEKTAAVDSVAVKPPMQPVEFADMKYSDIGRQGLAALSSGDIDGWLGNFTDNAVYVWNAGDSLAGKAAITAYWKKRRSEVMDSISFLNQIWLPIKVNQPQSVEQPGIWILGWYEVHVKYKTGKRMVQWIHTDQHFDANGKIDRVIQYLDRVPINAATKK